MKRILVACGTGIATSTVAARKIEEKLGERGITVEITQCKASDLAYHLDGQDLVVTTTLIDDAQGVPILSTVSFLTGIGIDADIDRIVELLGL
jgi:PTS system galactitol-specific IIB component